MIFPIALQDIYIGNSKFTEKEIDQIDLEAPDLIPNCVAAILRQSRPELSRSVPANRLCCTNPVWDSSHESSVVAGIHEQTYTPDLQDQELASLQ